MTLAELKVLIGDLTNDPNHERYTGSQIETELDNEQDRWNIEAKIISDTTSVNSVEGQHSYDITNLGGTPLDFDRVTYNGIDLAKRSESYFDHLSSHDWTTDTGTPTEYFIVASDPFNLVATVHPTPNVSDDDLTLQYTIQHTSMASDSDVPFMSGSTSNFLLRPYDWGLAYAVAARLLARDPSEVNASKSINFAAIGRDVKSSVIQVFKALEKEEPMRLRGGRVW